MSVRKMDAHKIIVKELHRPVRRNFLRRAVELEGLYNLYQTDLAEMIPYARVNKSYKYLMTMINVFEAEISESN